MKAVVISEHGGLEKLRVEQIPEPKPTENEVVVQVWAAGLNHLDIWVRKGRGSQNLREPHVLGSDAVGIVCATGSNVKTPKVGDEVVINPGLSCGQCESCRRGEHSECTSFGIIGMSRPGTFAEKVAVPARNTLAKPAHLNWEEAGAFVLSHTTAWRMVLTKGQVLPGQTVCIHGIGGGVALAALQFAKLAGAQVIVTSSSDQKLRRAKEIGADHIINYRTIDNISQYIKDITGGAGVDIVIDTVGAATWLIDFSVVRRGGKIVLCGVTSGAAAETDLRALYWNQLAILGSTMGSNADLAAMMRAMEKAKLKPIIDTVIAIEDAPQAMLKMETGEQFGKIVLKVRE
jgi:NADPH:quinone reductase-like Zn-dependent oxidoreductase